MKKRAFRLLAGALAIMISLSTPLQTRADSVGGNVGGGGSGGMTGTTDYKAWSASHQGYRFYIIDLDTKEQL